MAKFSMKRDGKEVGPASVYAKPHTMSGKTVSASEDPGKPSHLDNLQSLDIGIGLIDKDPTPKVKTTGIKIRGTGAATKGVMARGPMA